MRGLFNAYGFGVFGGWTFDEKIRLGGLIGSIIDVADTDAYDSENYAAVDEGDAVAQLGISYLF